MLRSQKAYLARPVKPIELEQIEALNACLKAEVEDYVNLAHAETGGSIDVSKLCSSLTEATEFVLESKRILNHLDQNDITDQGFVQLQLTNIVRARVTELFFEDRFYQELHTSLPEMADKPTVAELKESVTVIGFNRLFSKTNDFGASSFSDADIKVVANSALLDRAVGDRTFRDVLFTQLKVAEGFFSENLEFALEVQKFTITGTDELAAIAAGDAPETEKNFYATVIDNFSVLGGSSNTVATLFAQIKSQFAPGEQAQRAYDQYISAKTDKGECLPVGRVSRTNGDVKSRGG
ncbi:MAG: hypothetical protein ACI9BD_000290 [Candidatus Marinamargulisbacteria bacterium]|jgi:hypothetical protein